jgi:hypothetical protein
MPSRDIRESKALVHLPRDGAGSSLRLSLLLTEKWGLESGFQGRQLKKFITGVVHRAE